MRCVLLNYHDGNTEGREKRFYFLAFPPAQPRITTPISVGRRGRTPRRRHCSGHGRGYAHPLRGDGSGRRVSAGSSDGTTVGRAAARVPLPRGQCSRSEVRAPGGAGEGLQHPACRPRTGIFPFEGPGYPRAPRGDRDLPEEPTPLFPLSSPAAPSHAPAPAPGSSSPQWNRLGMMQAAAPR